MKNATKNANKNATVNNDFAEFEAAQAAQAKQSKLPAVEVTVEAVEAVPVEAAPVEAVEVEAVTVDSLQAQVNSLLAQLASNNVKTVRSTGMSAQAYVKQLLSVDGTALSVAELCAASGKTAVTIRTALTDLRNVKYARGGLFHTVGIKALDGITRYIKVQ